AADLELDRPRLVPDDDPRQELLPRLVEQVERRPIGLEQLRDLLEDQLEELIEIQRAPQRQPDVLERLRRPLGPREALLELAHLSLELPDAVQLRRHSLDANMTSPGG